MATVAAAHALIPAQVVDLSVKAPQGTPNLRINFYSRCEHNREEQAWEFVEQQSFYKFDLVLPSCQDICLTLTQCSSALFDVPDNQYTISVNDYTLVRHFDDHVRDFHNVQFLITGQWLHEGHNTLVIQIDQYARSRLMLKAIEVAGVYVQDHIIKH